MSSVVKVIAGIIIIVLIIWGISALVPNNETGGPATTSGEPIKIGFVGPLTGEAASLGEGGKAGLETALKEINDAGGVGGRKIEVVFEDDRCSKDGVSAFNKLISANDVTAIIGPICSASGGPGLPIAQKAGVPVIFWASAPSLTKIGDYVFRLYPSDAFQGKFAAEYVKNKLGKSRVAVLYVKNDWGQGLRDAFVNRFTELGGTTVYDDGAAQDTKDLKSSVSKIKAAKPDAIYFPAYPSLAIIGFKQMKDLGINVPILGGDAFEAEEVFKSEVAEGVMFTVGIIRNSDEFKAKIKDATGVESNFAAPPAYDALYVLAKIMRDVGTDRVAIKDALSKLDYRDGVSLPVIKMGPDRELTEAEFEVKVVKDGKAEVVK